MSDIDPKILQNLQPPQGLEEKWKKIEREYREEYPTLTEEDITYREGEFDDMLQQKLKVAIYKLSGTDITSLNLRNQFFRNKEKFRGWKEGAGSLPQENSPL